MTTYEFQPMAPAAFAALGMPEVAYVKAVDGVDGPSYEIHAANGRILATVPDRDLAFATVRQNDLEPVSVH